jgi:hypothetical protein
MDGSWCLARPMSVCTRPARNDPALIIIWWSGQHGFCLEVTVSVTGLVNGTDLMLFVGYSHPVKVVPPTGIRLRRCKTRQIVQGYDKELLGGCGRYPQGAPTGTLPG